MLKSRISDKHPYPASLLVVKYNFRVLDSNQHRRAFQLFFFKPPEGDKKILIKSDL